MGPRFWIGDALKLGVALLIVALGLQLLVQVLMGAAPLLIGLGVLGVAGWATWRVRQRNRGW